MTKRTFTVPKREEVSEPNKAIFDNIQKSIGFVPPLIAQFAIADGALPDFMTLEGRKSTLRIKEREAISLVVSQINGCRYCQSAHTITGKMNGFKDDQVLELRGGSAASFDPKLHALVQYTKSVVEHKGQASETAIENFFAAGYTEANAIDAIMAIGTTTISNYVAIAARVEINFPVAPEL